MELIIYIDIIGEGNGKPLQCSCLENLRDGGVWWAAVYGVAQNQTRLTRLSSSPTDVIYPSTVTEMTVQSKKTLES